MENKQNEPSLLPICIVVPVFNEEDNIEELHHQVRQAFLTKKLNFQLLFVDDGSCDETFNKIQKLHKKFPKEVRALRFSRNFGQHNAIMAGLEESKGDYTAIIDGDLQTNPENLIHFLDVAKSGYDNVFGVLDTKSERLFKRICSHLFWRSIEFLSGFELPRNQSTMRVMSRRFVNSLLNLEDNIPFFSGMCAWVGYPQKPVLIKHSKRFAGKSKYSFFSSLWLAWNGVTSFSIFPLKIAGFIGFFLSILSLSLGAYLIFQKVVYDHGITGWTSVMVSILGLSGLQLIVLGVFGEYLGRSYKQSLKRPRFIISEELKLYEAPASLKKVD